MLALLVDAYFQRGGVSLRCIKKYWILFVKTMIKESIGSLIFFVIKGPMIWYQKFEYAASHWLQKSTEHVFGCCLCSPGCFSLFRGSALNKVLDIYSTKPESSLHHIQYDLGNSILQIYLKSINDYIYYFFNNSLIQYYHCFHPLTWVCIVNYIFSRCPSFLKCIKCYNLFRIVQTRINAGARFL